MSSKTTSINKIKVAVAMATRDMAITPPIFNRKIKYFAQKCTVCTVILHPYFGFLLVQTKNNENHEFSHFFPEFIALSRKMNLTENNCKSCLHGILNAEYKNYEKLESVLRKWG